MSDENTGDAVGTAEGQAKDGGGGEASVLERLAKLEQENKTLKVASLAGLALAVCAVVLGLSIAGGGGTSSGVLAKDNFGKMRAVLGMTPTGSSHLTLGNLTGEAQLGLTVSPDGKAGLALGDQRGNPRILLAVAADGSSQLAFKDGNAKTRVSLGTASTGFPSLEFFDEKGEPMMALPPIKAKGEDGKGGKETEKGEEKASPAKPDAGKTDPDAGEKAK